MLLLCRCNRTMTPLTDCKIYCVSSSSFVHVYIFIPQPTSSFHVPLLISYVSQNASEWMSVRLPHMELRGLYPGAARARRYSEEVIEVLWSKSKGESPLLPDSQTCLEAALPAASQTPLSAQIGRLSLPLLLHVIFTSAALVSVCAGVMKEAVSVWFTRTDTKT